MQVRDILYEKPTDFAIIQADCSQFLAESQSHFVTRLLPTSYSNVQRVKIRQQRRADVVTRVFNEAFNQVHNLRQRSMIAQSFVPPRSDTHEPFYVFPINGYNYMYSREVQDSSLNYKQAIDVMFEQFDENTAANIISDVMKYTYTTSNLVEGISAKAEIIFYNIPYYYAVRSSQYPDYNTLITQIYN
jgi:hypothetical protein